MMAGNFSDIQITKKDAARIAKDYYNLDGEISELPGYQDFNFRVKDKEKSYILKISRPDEDLDYIEYQQALLSFINESGESMLTPLPIADVDGNYIGEIKDATGNTRLVRLLSWIDGRLWSSVNLRNDKLRFSLGQQAALLTKALQGFDHKLAHREFEWDLSQAGWTNDYLHLFSAEEQAIIRPFQERFTALQSTMSGLPKSVVHNDVNDNNILVTADLINPQVKAIIDFGDAIYTNTINDLAIVIAYAIFHKPDVLAASLPIIAGYNKVQTLQEAELEVLYTLIGMRLVVSITNSAINKTKEPTNEYLLISEKPAWEALRKWLAVNEGFALYSFRNICGFTAHPADKQFKNWAKKASISLGKMLPDARFNSIYSPDLSVGSTFLGNINNLNNVELFTYKTSQLQKEYPDRLAAGGYLEPRALYSTDAFKREGNNGFEHRTIHLGIDIWIEANTAIHAPLDGEVVAMHYNNQDKDYGPTLILKHQPSENLKFYTLYGHLNKTTLELFTVGDNIKKGALIGHVGESHENGNWPPHLHFQVMLDMLGYKTDFPGAATPQNLAVWQSLCPDPNLLFKEKDLIPTTQKKSEEIINIRHKILGKSLSLSYHQPLNIVRGDGVYLLDVNGQKYLDTINNVAHVGHEHPRVVKAGQEQMAVLNTNTRYLHKNITDFAEELLGTFPKELSVVHFVNSGSEANELALRMAEAYTGQKDMLAVEVGYHGNTNACINISSYKFDGKGGSGAPEHTHIVPLPDTYRGLYQGNDAGKRYSDHVLNAIAQVQQKGRNIAGFICESIISCGGQIELPEGYLKNTYRAVRIAGGLCIADEVQVGCGRVGKTFWGFELHGVIPDIVTIGKPIGNGHPLAAVVCTKDVAEAFANGMEYFNTFGGNPVSCAIGKSVLDVIKSENLQQNALKTGNYLKTELKKLKKTYSIIGDVRGQGLFLGLELVDKVKQPLTAQASYLANRMMEMGILMSTDGKDNNVMKIKPPLVFSIDNANELLARLKTVFNEDFMTSY